MSEDGADTITAQAAGAALARPAPALALGQELGGRYTITAELGRGGHGVVYLAFDRRARVEVALKALDTPGWLAEQSAEQLFRELRFGRSLRDPNVCQIHDVFEVQGRCYLTMEHASRGTLRATLLERAGHRPLQEKLDDVRAVVAGMAAIHGAGLVHRDLKPENILRTETGRLVVSDFGIARALAQTTVTTRVAGTPGYLAPEVVEGVEPSLAADVWSLGVVLHEILVGVRPHWTGAGWQLLLPGSADDRREAALYRVCRACLQPDPARRPASGAAARDLLERQLRRRFHVSRRLRRLARVVGAAAALVLAAGAVRAALRWIPVVGSCGGEGNEVCRLASGLCERWPDSTEHCRWPQLDADRCGVAAPRALDPPNQGIWTTSSRPGVTDGRGACLVAVRNLCTTAEWKKCRSYGAVTCESFAARMCRWHSDRPDCDSHVDKTCWGIWTSSSFGEGAPANGMPRNQEGACLSELYNLNGRPCP